MEKHPKQIEAEQRKAHNEALIEGAKSYKADLQFVDFPPNNTGFKGMNVAFRLHGRRVLELSTAVCHPVDRYSRKVGRAEATMAHVTGNTIRVRIPDLFKQPAGVKNTKHTDDRAARSLISAMFSPLQF